MPYVIDIHSWNTTSLHNFTHYVSVKIAFPDSRALLIVQNLRAVLHRATRGEWARNTLFFCTQLFPRENNVKLKSHSSRSLTIRKTLADIWATNRVHVKAGRNPAKFPKQQIDQPYHVTFSK